MIARRRSLGVIAAVAATVAIALFGSFLLVLTPSLGDRPGLQTLWVLFSLVLLKVPLLGLVWWMIARRRGRRRTDDAPQEPLEEFIARIEHDAALASAAPDPAGRLAAIRQETWARAGDADEADAPALVALALRLDGPRARRSPGPPRPGPEGGPAPTAPGGGAP